MTLRWIDTIAFTLLLMSLSLPMVAQQLDYISPDRPCASQPVAIYGERIAATSAQDTWLRIDSLWVSGADYIRAIDDGNGGNQDSIWLDLPPNLPPSVQITLYRDGDSSSSSTTFILALASPSASLSANAATVCAGDLVTLTFAVSGVGSSPVSLHYSANGVPFDTLVAGDGTYTVTHRPTVATTYGLDSLTHYNGCSWYIGRWRQVQVAPALTGSISLSESAVCAGESALLTVQVNNPSGDQLQVVYAQNGVDTMVTLTGAAFAVRQYPTQDRTYILRTITNLTQNNCSATLNDTVRLDWQARPTVGLSASAATICRGDAVTLTFSVTGAGSDAVTINYTANAVAADTTVPGDGLHTLVLHPTAATNYSLGSALTANGCVAALGATSVQVQVAPALTGSISLSESAVCAGESALLTVQVNNPSGDQLQVVYAQNGVDTMVTLTGAAFAVRQYPTQDRTYILRTITNLTQNNCSATLNDTVRLDWQARPTVGLSIVGSANILSGDTTQLRFAIANKNTANEPVTVTYLAGGVAQSLTVTGADTLIAVHPTTTTTYSLSSVASVISGCGTSSTQSVTVTVGASLTGSLSANATTLCAGEDAQLYFTVSNPSQEPLRVHYTLNSTAQSLSTNAAGAILPLTGLTATTVVTLDSIVQVASGVGHVVTGQSVTITVHPVPSATLAASANSVCFGETFDLTFAVTGRAPTDLVTITYAKGSALYTLSSSTQDTLVETVSDTLSRLFYLVGIENQTTGCEQSFVPSSTTTQQVNVTARINATISASSTVICEGESTNLIFSLDNPNGELMSLVYTDGATFDTLNTTSTTITRSVSPAATTTYELRQINNAAACGNAISGQVTVRVNKVPTVSISAGGISCSGQAVPITFSIGNKNSSTDNVTVNFLNAGVLQALATSQASTVFQASPATTTAYPLVSVVNNTVGCTNFNVSGNATVVVGGMFTGSIQASETEICLGESVDVTFLISNATGSVRVRYTRDGGLTTDSILLTSTSRTLTLNPLATTTYQLLSATELQTGCSVALSGSVQVIVNPLPVISLSGNAVICNGEQAPIQFALSSGTSPYLYSYREQFGSTVNDLSTSSASNRVVLRAPTADAIYYPLSLVDSKGCQAATLRDTVHVTVHPLPTATLSVTETEICRGDVFQLRLQVANNEGQNVRVYFERVTNGIARLDSAVTASQIILPESPDSTVQYRLVRTTNLATGCQQTVSGSAVVLVRQLPVVVPQVASSGTAVCDGASFAVNFNFPVGAPPYIVSYADSFSVDNFRNTTNSPWTNLTTGGSVVEPQSNSGTTGIEHFYMITRVVDGNGCVRDYPLYQEPTVSIEVNPTPAVFMNGVQDVSSPYASTDESRYPVQGLPGGGLFSGPGTGITLPLGSASVANFIPANAGFLPTDTIRDIFITYTYTDAVTGCIGSVTDTARIKKALTYQFYNEGDTSLQTVYCRNADSLYIYAKVLGNEPIGNNTFVLDAANAVIFGNVQSVGDSVRVTLNPIAATGTFNLKFGSTASGFITKTITIIDTISTVFSPIIDGSYFCQSESETVRLIGIPSQDVQSPYGYFTSPTPDLIRQDTSIGVNRGWFLRRHAPGWHRVVYTYVDTLTGCTTQEAQQVRIAPSPIADLGASIVCNDRQVTFSDSAYFEVDVSATDSLIAWSWSLGDGTVIQDSTGLNQGHTYASAGAYNVRLQVMSALGCNDQYDTSVVIGTIPVADFDWRFATLGDDTELIDLSTLPALGGPDSNYINRLVWTVGDGTPAVGGLRPAVDTFPHQYPSIGIYQAGLVAYTNNGCVDSTTRQLYIVPRIATYPYFEQFEADNGGWVRDSVTGVYNQWGWDYLRKRNIYEPNNRAWVTQPDSLPYSTGSDSWVYSPTFDLSTLPQPTMAFKYWCDSRLSDGAVIQYSIDSARTWQVLGRVGTGLDWYDVPNLAAQPGDQSGIVGFGWSQPNTGWKVARHKLDALSGESSVRFRIAFASVPGANDTYDGFAFDDFWVGSRKKRVLVEEFTNGGVINYMALRDSVYTRMAVGNNPQDVVHIEYHNDLPINDALNLFNPADPSARSLYYQFSNTGKTVIDGVLYNTANAASNGLNWTQQDLDLAMLREPQFHIAFDNVSLTTGQLDIVASIRARVPHGAVPRKAYLAVVEDQVPYNGKLHNGVLRKLLPSAAGISLNDAWSVGTSRQVAASWSFNANLLNTSQLSVVAWIQHTDSQEVYQVATTALADIPYDTTVVATREVATPLAFQLAPNPHAGDFQLFLDAPSDTPLRWSCLDLSGRLVAEGELPTGVFVHRISLPDAPAGMYWLVLRDTQGRTTTQKMVRH